LGLASGSAWAQQTITLSAPLTLTNQVCGNAVNTATGLCSSGFNTPDGNTLNIGSGVAVAGFAVWGGYGGSTTAAVTATGNTVNYSGSGGGSIYGGYANTSAAGLNATANDNTVKVSGAGAVATLVDGGYATAGTGGTASATGNTVEITGGTVSGIEINGAQARASGGTATASGNRVSISGGTVSSLNVFGGYTLGTTSTASDNTVEIKGSAVIGAGVNLYGGEAITTSTGNTLELSLKGVTVGYLQYFQNLNFHVPASLTAGQTMLTANTGVDLGNPAPAVSVEIASGSRLAVGDQIVLIDASAGAMTNTAPASVTSATAGYTFSIVGSPIADKKLVVEVTAVPPRSSGSAAAVPTLGEYGLALLALLLGGLGFAAMRRKG